MVEKNYTYKGMMLYQTNIPPSNYTVTESEGLVYTPTTPAGDGDIVGVAYHTHHAGEGPNVLWSAVALDLTQSTTASPVAYENIITLFGLNNNHTPELIGEEIYTTITSTPTTTKVLFDLLTSACQAPLSKEPSQTAAGKIRVTLPFRYINYDDIYLDYAWYNPLWTRRKAIPLTQSTTASTLQIQAVAVSYDADMQNDFDDIRFTDGDGKTILDHYLLKKTDGTSALYLVGVPNMNVGGGKNIYLYYGNTTTSSTSSLDVLEDHQSDYLFFDDFEDGATTGWNVSQGTMTVESATPITGTYSLKHTGNSSDTGDNCCYITRFGRPYVADFEFQLKTQGAGVNTPYAFLWVLSHYNTSNWLRFDTYYDSGSGYQKLRLFKNTGGGYVTYDTQNWMLGQLATGTPYQVRVVDTGSNAKLYIDGVLYINQNYDTTGWTGTYNTVGANRDSSALWDNIRVQSYPIVTGTVGGEETYGATTVTPDTPSDTLNYVLFTTPAGWVERTPLSLTVTEAAGEPYTTNAVSASTRDTLRLGYDGLDKYDTLRVGVETTTTSTPYTVALNNLEYKYEV